MPDVQGLKRAILSPFIILAAARNQAQIQDDLSTGWLSQRARSEQSS
jgi:hypothetical protein